MQIPKFWNKGSKESWHAIYDGKDLIGEDGQISLVNSKTSFFGKHSLKMVKQITSPENALNYHSNQTFIAESRVVSSPRAWELDESHSICLVVSGASPRA
jgi:hypothetical protein